MLIAGEAPEKDKVVFGWDGKGEGVFQIGSEFFETLWGFPTRMSHGRFGVWVEVVEVGTASPG